MIGYNVSSDKPVKDGWYWIKIPNCQPEIVRVFFNTLYRRKNVNRVLGLHWNANLADIKDAEWSDEIIYGNP